MAGPHTMPAALLFINEMGWSGGAMVLGKHSVPGRPTYLN